jgi:hypothetical protein
MFAQLNHPHSKIKTLLQNRILTPPPIFTHTTILNHQSSIINYQLSIICITSSIKAVFCSTTPS